MQIYIYRKNQFYGSLRQIRLYVDGQKQSKIKADKISTFTLPDESHSIQLKSLIFSQSKIINIYQEDNSHPSDVYLISGYNLPVWFSWIFIFFQSFISTQKDIKQLFLTIVDEKTFFEYREKHKMVVALEKVFRKEPWANRLIIFTTALCNILVILIGFYLYQKSNRTISDYTYFYMGYFFFLIYLSYLTINLLSNYFSKSKSILCDSFKRNYTKSLSLFIVYTYFFNRQMSYNLFLWVNVSMALFLYLYSSIFPRVIRFENYDGDKKKREQIQLYYEKKNKELFSKKGIVYPLLFLLPLMGIIFIIIRCRNELLVYVLPLIYAFLYCPILYYFRLKKKDLIKENEFFKIFLPLWLNKKVKKLRLIG